MSQSSKRAKKRRSTQQQSLQEQSGLVTSQVSPGSVPVTFQAALGSTDEPSGDEPVRGQELAPLSFKELSDRYGLGFELLRRMGYGSGPNGLSLRAGSLQAPLQARRNQGRQGLAADAESDFPSLDTQESQEPQTTEDLTALLSSVLADMREAGDTEEAEELQHMASFCHLKGEALEDVPRPKRRPLKRKVLEESRNIGTEHGQAASGDIQAEMEALRAVHQSFSSEEFPVELERQAEHLQWNRRWRKELGSYEEFLDRQGSELRTVRCPAGHTLVLPRWSQQSASQVPPGLRSRYVAWCRQQRLAASGKAKRKWKHLEKTFARLCPCSEESTNCIAESSKSSAAEPASQAHQAKTKDKAAAPQREQAELAKIPSASPAEDEVDAPDLGWTIDTEGLESEV
eukprot:TRINITY_DN92441_c0_g1_i1.p1 TRINITY_DN92441_c0_g1~~TRINITY_DN92441_c0_g1_i1.p1  ORF type:complete len:401 (-),score=106.25 TRINITY_DN92441_c0_g1_i1:30-1232(-)